MPQAHLVEAQGARIPAIGFGTWSLSGDECVAAVEAALASGYRHLDTAANYQNETEVGQGLRSSGLRRDDVFVTTKVWWTDIAAGNFERSAERSLERLGLDQVDLLLIHWPNPAVPLKESLAALCRMRAQGLTRHIGISNFTTGMIEEAVALATEPLAVNQVEYHPYLRQDRVMEACRRHGLAFTAYSPLGRAALLDDGTLQDLARAHGRTTSQIVLRWHVQQPGVIAIPRSRTAKHIAQNLNVFDFSLSDDEMRRISGLARPGGRFVDPPFAPAWDQDV
jgi:diketogulonate reductase-like aldo/keto reductase